MGWVFQNFGNVRGSFHDVGQERHELPIGISSTHTHYLSHIFFYRFERQATFIWIVDIPKNKDYIFSSCICPHFLKLTSVSTSFVWPLRAVH